MSILDEYVLKKPSRQNIIDIFGDEWSSRFPDDSGLVAKPGTAALFDDPRIRWAAEQLGGFAGASIIELGPLEAAHTTMMERMGARRIIAIEANTRAFLKCLCVKEIFALSRCEFQLGDFVEFLRESPPAFDIAIASGVLYHMMNPLELLELLSRTSDRLFLWTHYYDESIIRSNSNLSHKFGDVLSVDSANATFQWVEQSYKTATNWAGFCGGGQSTSRWLTRESLLTALRHFGFGKVVTGFEQPDHPNGPALALCAWKTQPDSVVSG